MQSWMIRFVYSKAGQGQDNGFQRLIIIFSIINDTQARQFYHFFTSFAIFYHFTMYAIFYHFTLFTILPYFFKKEEQIVPFLVYLLRLGDSCFLREQGPHISLTARHHREWMNETTEEVSSETAVMQYCELSFCTFVSMKREQSYNWKARKSWLTDRLI